MTGPYETLGEIEELMLHLPGQAWQGEMRRQPWWVTQAIRKASVLLAGQSIAFVTGAPYKAPTFDTTSAGNPVPSVPGRLAIFGARHVVISDIEEGAQPDEARTKTQLVSRTGLIEIHPVEAHVASAPNGKSWPHEQDLLLVYSGVNRPVNLLPEGTMEHSSVLQVIQTFVPSLLDDLDPRGRE